MNPMDFLQRFQIPNQEFQHQKFAYNFRSCKAFFKRCAQGHLYYKYAMQKFGHKKYAEIFDIFDLGFQANCTEFLLVSGSLTHIKANVIPIQ